MTNEGKVNRARGFLSSTVKHGGVYALGMILSRLAGCYAGAVLGICSVLACQPRVDALSDGERRAVTGAVTAGMLSYAEALGTLDSTRILGHYVASPDFRLASDGSAHSYTDMEKIIGGLRATLKSTGVRWDTVAVTVLGRDAAFVYAPFRRTDTVMKGTVARIRGNATWVWVRRDGAWRMLYGHAITNEGVASTL